MTDRARMVVAEHFNIEAMAQKFLEKQRALGWTDTQIVDFLYQIRDAWSDDLPHARALVDLMLKELDPPERHR